MYANIRIYHNFVDIYQYNTDITQTYPNKYQHITSFIMEN